VKTRVTISACDGARYPAHHNKFAPLTGIIDQVAAGTSVKNLEQRVLVREILEYISTQKGSFCFQLDSPWVIAKPKGVDRS
jgi:hypothetical protein